MSPSRKKPTSNPKPQKPRRSRKAGDASGRGAVGAGQSSRRGPSTQLDDDFIQRRFDQLYETRVRPWQLAQQVQGVVGTSPLTQPVPTRRNGGMGEAESKPPAPVVPPTPPRAATPPVVAAAVPVPAPAATAGELDVGRPTRMANPHPEYEFSDEEEDAGIENARHSLAVELQNTVDMDERRKNRSAE